MSGTPYKIGVIGARGIGNLQGGIERFCSSFYRKLPPDKFDVTVFVRQPLIPDDLPSHVRIHYLPAPRRPAFQTIVHSIRSVMAAHRFGIQTLHVHGIGACLALPLASALGIRSIVRHLGADYDRKQWGCAAKAVLRVGEKFAGIFAESIVCLNPQIAEQFRRSTGRTSRVFVLPNGTDAPPTRVPTSILRWLAVVEGRYVLAVGRLVSDKNFHVLAQAFLEARLPHDVKLVIVGAIDREPSYFRSLARSCADQSRIVLPGPIFGPDLWSLYRHAGLFVIPSAHEGMSFSLLEAAVSGAKIVASDISANSYVCREYARLVEVGSVDALREAIECEWARERVEEEVAGQIMLCTTRHDWLAVVKAMIPILLPTEQGRVLPVECVP